MTVATAYPDFRTVPPLGIPFRRQVGCRVAVDDDHVEVVVSMRTAVGAWVASMSMWCRCPPPSGLGLNLHAITTPTPRSRTTANASAGASVSVTSTAIWRVSTSRTGPRRPNLLVSARTMSRSAA
jgi:hypothetical protein